MIRCTYTRPRKLRLYGPRDLQRIDQLQRLTPADRRSIAAAACVFPFRVNNYVVEELIDWSNWQDDPIFNLTFPQRGMLDDADFQLLYERLRRGDQQGGLARLVRRIRRKLNPHPAGQIDLNVPYLNGEPLPGLQHKYRETVLFFPRQGQTCHTYCTYCFRWPQFIGDPDLKIASADVASLVTYLERHREVTDVLITGGDPMVMSARLLQAIIEPLLSPRLRHVANIRIGTKSLSWWPYRFLTDRDSDDLLRLFTRVGQAGRHLAFMAHVSHPRELEPPEVGRAMARILQTGAVIRCQSPLVRHVNADAKTWATLWSREVALGAVPYYMFVERNTGAVHYFEVPLLAAWEIFRDAHSSVSGLARTARGPSMSALPGKIVVNGVATVHGQDVLTFEFEQARDPDWVGRPFFAELDPTATWLDDLHPAFGRDEFFFADAMRDFQRQRAQKLREIKAQA